MTELRALLLKAHGQAQAFKMIDVNPRSPVDAECELRAAKETGIQLLETIQAALKLCPSSDKEKS